MINELKRELNVKEANYQDQLKKLQSELTVFPY